MIGLKDDRSLLNSNVLSSLPLIMSAISISSLTSSIFKAYHLSLFTSHIVSTLVTYTLSAKSSSHARWPYPQLRRLSYMSGCIATSCIFYCILKYSISGKTRLYHSYLGLYDGELRSSFAQVIGWLGYIHIPKKIPASIASPIFRFSDLLNFSFGILSSHHPSSLVRHFPSHLLIF